MKATYLLLILLSTTPVVSHSSSILQINTLQLVNDAELVFEGEVVATRTEYIPAGAIVTYVDFQLLDVIKGDVEAGDVITLRFTGGKVGDLKLDVGSDIPALAERGLYFVEAQNGQLTNPLLGWSQGHFKIQRDGSLLAGNKQRVVGVTLESHSRPGLSTGVALGIITATQNELASGSPQRKTSKPVSVDEFKNLIKGFRQ